MRRIVIIIIAVLTMMTVNSQTLTEPVMDEIYNQS